VSDVAEATKWRNRSLVLAVFMLVYFGLSALMPRDDTDPSTGRRSGLILYIDHGTGCQYVRGGLLGGTTPRLDANGRQICRSAP
jgi:hypothetical protein